jgi:hypothetical protein
LAKPNYRQAKRHKELARKARQEQKIRRRSARDVSTPENAEQDHAAAPGQPNQPSSSPDT